ncbi:MAG: dihydropteroate synthase, partial [Kiritimatiellae bacterium]|nr:dihydropteroate synthase [Kiritimatiellia bacterium]
PAKDYRPVGAQVLQDPMVGFGTTREEDVAILGSLRALAARGPVLVGVSRKRVIGALSGEGEPARRLGGSVGAAVWCAMCGASVVRVHDVKETKEALAVVGALAQQEGGATWNGIK